MEHPAIYTKTKSPKFTQQPWIQIVQSPPPLCSHHSLVASPPPLSPLSPSWSASSASVLCSGAFLKRTDGLMSPSFLYYWVSAELVTLAVSKWKSLRILVFNKELFFIYFLPPIIFNAGFQVKKKQFFQNFSAILLFGVVSTLMSFCIISPGAYFLFKEIGVTSLSTEDYLAIGALFSATDYVCTLQVLNQEKTLFLYSLVFGEEVVNDVTSIVLFNAT